MEVSMEFLTEYEKGYADGFAAAKDEYTCTIVNIEDKVEDENGRIVDPTTYELSCGHDAHWHIPINCPRCGKMVIDPMNRFDR